MRNLPLFLYKNQLTRTYGDGPMNAESWKTRGLLRQKMLTSGLLQSKKRLTSQR